MNNSSNYYKIGVFVTAFFVIFLVFAFWLGKFGMDSKKYDTYFVNFNESISGLNIGSSVKFMGYEIGFVSSIDIDKTKDEEIRVGLSILKNTPIKVDSIAVLGNLGITGLKYIELRGGSGGATELEPHSSIASQKSSLTTIEEFAIDFSVEFMDVMGIIKSMLSEENLENLASTVENSSKLTKKLDEFLAYLIKNEEKFDSVLDSVDSFATTGDKAFESMDRTAEEYSEFLSEFKLEFDKGSFDLRSISKDTLEELEALIMTLNSLVQKLEESPSDLIFKKKATVYGPGE